ncbi:MAG: hypothetical protein GY822_07060 [Deltaproteobacteria bacterium]|nr:hypothetical protein [Deltaproteobacteria bacterium]
MTTESTPKVGAEHDDKDLPLVGRLVSSLWVIFLLTTLLVGVLLRLILAGEMAIDVLKTPFAYWRHAHSHLGYYGVLFPLLFYAWRRRGGKGISQRTMALYMASALLAFVGFARSGYALLSIVGSTVIGALWLVQSIRQRMFFQMIRHRTSSPLTTVPIALFIACCFVPPIALFTRRDPYFAGQLVHTFLGVLLITVAAPTVLSTLNMRRLPWHLSSWGSFSFGLMAALYFGVMPSAWLGLPVVALGVVWLAQLLVSAECMGCVDEFETEGARNSAAQSGRSDVKVAFVLAALGMIAQGFMSVPMLPMRSIAGIHFLILGPLLMGLVRERWPTLPFALSWTWLLSVGVLSSSLWTATYAFAASWMMQLQALSAVAGIALMSLVIVAWLWLQKSKAAEKG